MMMEALMLTIFPYDYNVLKSFTFQNCSFLEMDQILALEHVRGVLPFGSGQKKITGLASKFRGSLTFIGIAYFLESEF